MFIYYASMFARTPGPVNIISLKHKGEIFRVDAMNLRGEKVQFHTFLTLVLDCGEW
jgi:hypothetical protein